MNKVKVVLVCLVTAVLTACASIRPASLQAPSGIPTTDLTTSSVEFELEIKAASHPLIAIRGLAADQEGNLFVVDCGGNRIQKFDGEGNFITTWGSEGTGNGQLVLWLGENDTPSGDVAVDREGRVVVADLGNSRIQVFDSNGEFLLKWGELGTGDGQFFRPVGVAVGPEGDVYVTDVSRGDVQRFDSEGQFLAKWRVPDMEYGQVVALAVDAEGNVYVPTSEARNVSKFDGDGNLLARIGEAGTGDGQFGHPVAVAVDSQGNVYVADESLHRIQVFGREGDFLRGWGSMGTGQGEFRSPSGLAAAADGSIYVADANNRVQKFRQW